MKKIDLNTLSKRNGYGLDNFIREVKREMEFIKYGDNYIIKHSNGKVVSEKEKLELEKNNIIDEDCGCGVEKIKKVSNINKKLKKIEKEKKIPIIESEEDIPKILEENKEYIMDNVEVKISKENFEPKVTIKKLATKEVVDDTIKETSTTI